MNKVVELLYLLMVFFCPTLLFGQEQLVKTAIKSSKKLFMTETKTLAKESAEAANKAILKDAFKVGSEEIGRNYMEKATAKQLIRGAVRKSILKDIEEKELGSILHYGMINAKKEIMHTEKSVVKEVAEKEAKKVNYKGCVSSLKSILYKESKNNIPRLIKLYCGNDGFKKFMALSIRDKMVQIQQITKYVYSLPQAERNKVLASMSSEMCAKIKKMNYLMTHNMPKKLSPKGRWTGERGNSVFILNDNYVWEDQKTHIKMSVKDLKKKYKIKGEIRVKYRDGEPIFDKSNSLGTTTVEYKPNYNYKDLKDLHNSVNENLAKKPWIKAKVNEKATDPVRDYIENAATDGSRVSGARNTYHEARDGETIYLVPDFIHDICKHNGGRSVAALVQK